jgi:hypothetical protein
MARHPGVRGTPRRHDQQSWNPVAPPGAFSFQDSRSWEVSQAPTPPRTYGHRKPLPSGHIRWRRQASRPARGRGNAVRPAGRTALLHGALHPLRGLLAGLSTAEEDQRRSSGYRSLRRLRQLCRHQRRQRVSGLGSDVVTGGAKAAPPRSAAQRRPHMDWVAVRPAPASASSARVGCTLVGSRGRVVAGIRVADSGVSAQGVVVNGSGARQRHATGGGSAGAGRGSSEYESSDGQRLPLSVPLAWWGPKV